MELKSILEALLFSSQKPLTAKELRDVLRAVGKESGDAAAKKLGKTKLNEVTAALEEMAGEIEALGRSFKLVCVAGGWQFVTGSEQAPWLRVLLGAKERPTRLSAPALETLAIIAYRQPLTRAEMEQIRGVSVDGVVATLLERGLVEKVGQAEVPGRPALYGTTAQFLEYFGLRNLEELPAADDLRRIVIEKPEGIPTIEPGLATAVEGGEDSEAAADEAPVSREPEDSEAAAGESREADDQTPESSRDDESTEASGDAGAEAPGEDDETRSGGEGAEATEGGDPEARTGNE